MRIRTRVLPALALPLLLAAATGCSSSAAPGPAAAARPTADTAVDAAPGPAADTAAPTAEAPAAVASPAASGRPAARPAGSHGVRLVAYDRGTGKAVLDTPTAPGGGTGGTAGPDPDAVRPGRLIASPPTPAAPRGALVAVTGVQKTGNGRVEVTTRPAEVSELLGATTAELHSAVDPHAISVQPLVKDLKVAFATRPGGGTGSASARLVLAAHTSVPLPGRAAADLSADVELDPAVDFSYDGTRLLKGGPEQARVGFALGAHADWKVSAALTASATPLRVPIAKLSASPVLTVAGFPVVVNLDLTCYLTVGADGTVTVDTEQDLDGRWAVHADYHRGQGWASTADPGTTTVGPVRARLAGNATLRTGLSAEASVGLYDTVGVGATVAPYLSSRVAGAVTADTSGKPPHIEGSWSNTAGLDIDGKVFARISVLGTPLFSKDLPLPGYHREWPLPSVGATR
ncbi:hypothetical protein [Kitasatospora sp. NPDC059571]|uniref:hypothetical protein n=1 Tax=Kitasatospora sp. NPDC059571 TaxID=3346871 RepID=UPI00368E2E84